METNKKNTSEVIVPSGPDFFKQLWEESWVYIKTVVDVVREPILVLDKDFRVIAANEPFYQVFQVEPGDTARATALRVGPFAARGAQDDGRFHHGVDGVTGGAFEGAENGHGFAQAFDGERHGKECAALEANGGAGVDDADTAIGRDGKSRGCVPRIMRRA